MKRTVAALALSVSTPSFALMIPAAQTKTICLDTFETDKGVKYSGNCDQSANNKELGTALLENGCAADQIALTSVGYPVYNPNSKENEKPEIKFDIEIKACLPPNVAQL